MNATPDGFDLNAIISAGILGVKVASLKQGPQGAESRPEGVKPLGTADEYTKRVYFYHSQLVDELQDLNKKINELMTRLFGDKSLRQCGPFLVALCNGSKLDIAEQIAKLELEGYNKQALVKQVDALFWAEVRRRNPTLYGWSKIMVHSDWTFTGTDAEEEPESLFGSMFGGDGGDLDISSLFSLLRRHKGNGEGFFTVDLGGERRGRRDQH